MREGGIVRKQPQLFEAVSTSSNEKHARRLVFLGGGGGLSLPESCEVLEAFTEIRKHFN